MKLRDIDRLMKFVVGEKHQIRDIDWLDLRPGAEQIRLVQDSSIDQLMTAKGLYMFYSDEKSLGIGE